MKKYLIVKIAAIGDVIMALPMVKKIRQVNPEAHITWVCGKVVKPILEQFPIDELVIIDEKNLLTGNKLQKAYEVIKIWKKIAFRHYDVIAVGHASRRYKLLTFLTDGIMKNHFSHVMGEMWPIPGRHHSDEYVRLIQEKDTLDQGDCVGATHLFIEPDSVVEEILKLCKERKTIVLSPGGAKNSLADDGCRRWPIKRYVELALLLIKNDYQVILTGGKGDRWVQGYFKKIPIIDAIGKTNLLELIALFGKVDALVTHDSGPLHLAGLTDVKVVAVFGPTNPWEKVPNRENISVIWNRDKYACCPCYDGKYYADCEHNDCLNNITSNDVFSILLKLIK